MSSKRHRRRLVLLVGVHVLVGLVMGLIARSFLNFNWPLWMGIGYLGLLCSEIVLLGAWTGLSTNLWWTKLLGLALGIAWLTGISLSPVPRPTALNVLEIAAAVGSTVVAVALFLGVVRWLFAKVDQRSEWDLRPVAEELQFSLRSLIGLTMTVSLVLALGRLVQWLNVDNSSYLMTMLVFGLIALLATALLVWSCLGKGRVIVRLPAMFGGMLGLGLVYPYYLGGAQWRFIIWPALMTVIAFVAGASLLVVRSCGYRIVPLRPREVPLTGDPENSELMHG